MIFALIGNQNCGKTTLFNALTGLNQHVGNFPGITVEQKVGKIKNLTNYSIVDLPGIYSLRPYSQEEIITREFLLKEKPDGIINIIDATNLERNLYLTLQLLELKIPIILVLNMMDELQNNGGKINVSKLSKELKIPVIPTNAKKNEGISEIINSLLDINNFKPISPDLIFSNNYKTQNCINTISNIINKSATKLNISQLFCATKIMENDLHIKKLLNIRKEDEKIIESIINKLEIEVGNDRNSILASIRYNFIESICSKTVIKPIENNNNYLSEKIDKILTNKYLGIPIFFVIIITVFWLTFSVIGNTLSTKLSYVIDYLCTITDNLLYAFNINPIIHNLIINGIFAGVGSVLSFLPIIVTLFFFLSILEDTGYMARISFILDKPFRKLGLQGKSFLAMLMGFGCSVPAIMSTRTLSSKHDRTLATLLIPFISCSAKIPIYTVFCASFIKRYSLLVIIGLYILGVITGIIILLLLKPNFYHKKSSTFIMELPNYRFPSIKNIFRIMWDKAKEFLEKAFSIIFLSSIIIWFLKTFDLNLNIVTDTSASILAVISRTITPIFMPLGFGDWRIITALISGLTAKESVISTLGILLNATTLELHHILPTIFTPLTAFSFLIFTLLYTPCLATVATIRKEFTSPIKALFVVLFQCIVAWIVSFIFFTIATIVINIF